MKRICVISLLLLLAGYAVSQPLERRQDYDISKDRVLYTIGYAHLDTEWNWEYPTTINEYIKNTMEDNFALFEKYPDYVFNFTGSRRYRMMKEYYPESYKKVKDYIKQGRWYISGSSVDEGEVNISSSESVLRQVLYGNLFFRREFNKVSSDYMLPDCFGFVATMPSIWRHAGLLGFSTQKLTWGSANGLPFNVGIWEGPDGKGLLAALNPTSYSGRLVERLDRDSSWTARIQDDIDKYGVSFDFRYYGVGDVGGAPRESDVRNAVGSVKNSDSNFKVILTSSDQIFKDITPELAKRLPTFSGDLLLTEHSAGSMTSESFMKRANRKNEELARSAEEASVMADWMGGANYPFGKINSAWELVLGSQFHDILPGTSTVRAYEYAWNDEFIAMNTFSEVLKNAVGNITSGLNTQADGRAIVVYNPVPHSREDVVTATLEFAKRPEGVKVTDKDGNTLPTQILSSDGNKMTIIFLAKLPPAGLAVFDLQETKDQQPASELMVTDRTLENKFLKVTLDEKGNIAGIYDKRAHREALSMPATLDFQHESPSQWPAWNMDWDDRKNPPFDYMDKDVTMRIAENGPVRVAIEVSKKGQNSEITQLISLAGGEAGKVIVVSNKIDWQSRAVSLKAAFHTSVTNEFATYSLNTAAVQRTTNNEVKYEVPGRQWIDLTDRPNNYGISILEDCKYGSDKPDNSTLRLTLMYTPKANSYVYQGTQDWGIHDVKYGIYPHVGDWRYAETPWEGHFLNNPPIAFETSKHAGELGKEFSFIEINSGQVDLMALKKAEESDYYIVRVNELYGKDANDIRISFPGKITDAYEVNGQEQRIGNADFSGGTLNLNMTRFAIRSFAIKLDGAPATLFRPQQTSLDLVYNEDGFSFDSDRGDGNITGNMTMPAELIPGEVVSEDIAFRIGSTKDGQKNMLSANGQKIDLPAGNYNKLYLLAAATGDVTGTIRVGDKKYDINFQEWTGFVGQHYSRDLYFNNLKVAAIKNAFTKRDNIAWFVSHRHNPESNDAYNYSYLYKYEIDIPEGTRSVTLPSDKRIKIFAVTVANNRKDNARPLQLLYDDFRNNKPVILREREIITPGLEPVSYKQVPLFTELPDESVLSRMRQRFRDAGLDTIVVTLPSSSDYADSRAGNSVTAYYYPVGRSSGGVDYTGRKIDLSNILNSSPLKDSMFFDNGRGRIVIDLQKTIAVDRLNIYFPAQGGLNQSGDQQIFSIWASDSVSDFTGDPKGKGWKYVGYYIGRSGRGSAGSGISFIFDDDLSCRYIMFISDGTWHSSDYFSQVDVFGK